MENKKKQDYYFTKNNMIIECVKYDVPDLIMGKVGATTFKHFKTVVNKMNYDNVLDFGVLKLSEVQIKRLRSKLHKAGFIRKLKLNDKWNWYCNPYLYNKDNRVKSELENIFKYNKDNKNFLELNF